MKRVDVIGCASRGRSKGKWHKSEHGQTIEFNSRIYSNSITTVQKDFFVALIYETN